MTSIIMKIFKNSKREYGKFSPMNAEHGTFNTPAKQKKKIMCKRELQMA